MSLAETAPLASNALAAFLDDPACVLREDGLIDQIIEELERQNADLPDAMDTNKARDAVRSAATKVNRMKAPVDTAKKAMTEEYRKQTAAVNGRANVAIYKLQALEDSIRAPLTEWEDVERAREEQIATLFEQLNAAGHVGFDETPEDIQARVGIIQALEIDAPLLGDRTEEAERKRASVIEYLTQARAKMIEEAERAAELERLKREAAEREAAEAERLAEEQRRKAEEERARQQAEAAAEEARLDERRKADEESATKVRAAEEEAARLRKAAAAKEETERKAREAQAVREADQKHRAKITGEVAAAIVQTAGVTTDQAEKIVAAIKAGDVPHVRINF